MFCPECGKRNPNQAVLCKECGHDLREVVKARKEEGDAAAKTCRLAEWSVGLGAVSIILNIVAGIPAVICGHLALVRIHWSNGRLCGYGKALGGLVLGYMSILVFFYILIPDLQYERERGRRAQCIDNLHQIGRACEIYAKNHQGMFPDKLSRLYPEYLNSTSFFICLGDKRGIAHGALTPEAIDQGMSYRYFPGLKAADRPDKVLAEDKPENHNQEGRHVLQVDGSVIWKKAK